MTNIALLDIKAHRDLCVETGVSARFGDAKRFVPVIVGEFVHVAAHYPILLSKDAETGGFFCGAMLGIDEDENLFLTEGQPFETYRPLSLQRGPFFTSGSDIAIDLDHPRVGGGQALFDVEGQPSLYLKSIMNLFRDLKPGLDQTRVFVETLLSLKLIEPIDISLAFDDGSRRRLEDLYTVNQEALNALPDDKVVELFRRGYLRAIYLMIASLKQLPMLAQKKNARLAR